jgi:hypothetical protein
MTTVQLSYRQVIDAAAANFFEQQVIHLSYEEYKMKSQAYNTEGKYNTFSQLKAADGRANSLHYKAGFAIGGLIEGLNKQIPILQDTQDKTIAFDTFQFEIIESDISNKAAHKIAITYFTNEFILIDNFGGVLLLSRKYKAHGVDEEQEELFMLALQQGLSISNYKNG